MKKYGFAALLVTFLAAAADAATVQERWGPAGIASTHPNTLRTVVKNKISVTEIDLSALPKEAKVFRATLRNKRVSQPKDPIEIRVVAKVGANGELEYEGKPLALEAPGYASYDLTGLVKTWQQDPAKNHGLALVRSENFDPRSAYVDICYEGTPKDAPPQVSNLKAVHHDGQTFLTWKEMAQFQPAADKTFWVGNFSRGKVEAAMEPGKGFMDMPRLPCIRQGELRRLQMYDIIPPPSGTQAYPKYVRQKGWPDVCYRVYRSKNKITAENIKDATLVGEADVLCGYDQGMIAIGSHGEYYDKFEIPENPLPTYCLEEGKGITPGEAFYVHTAQDEGPFYYGVTVVKDGTENMADVSAENSLQAPMEEKKAPSKPVLQFVLDEASYRTYKYYCWPAPPACNQPFQKPLVVTLSVPKVPKEPYGLKVGGSELPGPDWLALVATPRFFYDGQLAYNEGLGTFRAVSECKVDYYDERYLLYNIHGILSKWNIDRNRVIYCGGGLAFAFRHPELFKIMHPSTRGFGDDFEINFDPKWNPAYGSLFSVFGPPDAAMTVDGLKAWDIVGTDWYFKNNPTKDVPFLFANISGKESGHAIEFGWQDDPKGWAALRDGRVPYAGRWGGGRISPEVVKLVYAMPLNKTLPAFSNCSLDGNPGNGDPSDGDPWGSFNGYLIWDPEASVEEEGRWEMTVGLTGDCFATTCTVDITPRRCQAFKPKPGAEFSWTNIALKDNKEVQSGTVKADRWGLVTIPEAAVTKGKNRIRITKKD